MPILRNTAEGKTHNANVTAGGSGGTAGDPFDAVSNIPVYSNAAPYGGSMGILFDGLAADYVVWISSIPASVSQAWIRIVGRLLALPTGNSTIANFREANGTTVGTDFRITATGALQSRPNSVVEDTSPAMFVANQDFRLEIGLVSHATLGAVEVRFYTGANIEGSTPDVTRVLTNENTGDGTIKGFAGGWIVTPVGNPGLIFHDIAFSTEGWLGPLLGGPKGIQESRMGLWSNEDQPSAALENPYDSLLIPVEGAWFGAVVAAQDASTSSTPAGLTLWNSMSGIRPPDIIGIYKTGSWNGIFSTNELAMLSNSGAGNPAIPHLRYKPGSGSTAGSWANAASGVYNTQMDTMFNNLKNYPGKIFISIFHEPEDDEGPTGYSAANYIGMWQTARARADLAGCTNLIWVLNYVGYSNHAGNASGADFQAIYPGDSYVDWIAWDPYVIGTVRDTLAELVNENYAGPSGWTGFYNWASLKGKPLMLAEFGVDGGPDSVHGNVSEALAATILNNWSSALTSFPNLKAYQYWHADGEGDYQLTGRSVGITEFVNFTNNSFFDQDTSYAML